MLREASTLALDPEALIPDAGCNYRNAVMARSKDCWAAAEVAFTACGTSTIVGRGDGRSA